MVVLIYPDESRKTVNVCKPHMNDIAEWLQLSTNNNMKLPKLPKSLERPAQQNLYQFNK